MMGEHESGAPTALRPEAFDAIVLAGGRGSRLGLVDKATLDVGDGPLLAGVLEAVGDARNVVVVGPNRDLPNRVHQVREEPVFGGPAAAVVTGLRALEADSAPWTLVLACDLPLAREAVPLLLDARNGHGGVLVDSHGAPQWVAGVYPTAALAEAARRIGDPTDRPVRVLFEPLNAAAVPAPGRIGEDVDTWDQVSEWNDYFIDAEES